jgi:hypothetical protein
MTGYGMPRPPDIWPRRVVGMAVRALPNGLARDRYRHEFLAELYGMSRGRQLRHVTHLLARSFALRAAVDHNRQPSTLELVMPVLSPRKPLFCRLNLHHKWVRRFNPQGEDYLQCKACGKDRYDVERGSGPNTGGNIAGFGMSSGGGF